MNRAWVLATCKLAALIFTCKYAYFNFYYYCFFYIFFGSLIARDKYLLFYKRVVLSFGYYMLIFYPLFFLSEPSTSPYNITWKKMNETSYRISWNPLPRNTSNGRVIAYEVKQTKLSTSRTARSVSTPTVLQNTSDTFIVLTDLLSCSVYKVEVRAYTLAGPGVFGRLNRNIATSGIEYSKCKSNVNVNIVLSTPLGAFSGIIYNTGCGTLPDCLRCSLQVMKE